MAAKSDESHISVDRRLFDKVAKDSQLASAIIQPISLEFMLTTIIEAHFLQRKKEVKKLMTINMIQKARLAYLLGLISKTVLSDLEQIHEIRNKFAHNFSADFASTKVSKFVRKLSTTKGQKFTAKNSFTFYNDAVRDCILIIKTKFGKQ